MGVKILTTLTLSFTPALTLPRQGGGDNIAKLFNFAL
jgi:hypothetical protein